MTIRIANNPERRRAPKIRGSAGFTIAEVVVVVALIALILSVGLPAMAKFYVRHQTASAAAMVQTLVQRARLSALKEKRDYRVVLHDENGSPANRIEIQRDSGGSYVTVAGEVHGIPGAVRILGSSPNDSVDSVTVNSRGECTSGDVYVTKDGEAYGHVTISATCLARIL